MNIRKLQLILNKIVRIATISFAAVAFFNTNVSADLLVNQIYDSTQIAPFSNVGGVVIADDLILYENSLITGITWYGFYDTDLDSGVSEVDFRISLYDHSTLDLVPGTSFFDQTVTASVLDTGIDTTTLGTSVYQFSVDSISIAINGFERNWLAIAEDDSSTLRSGSTQWRWSRAVLWGGYGISNAYSNNYSNWQRGSYSMGFELYGTSAPVPEPATMLLLGTGLLGLAGVTIRRRKK
jgi:hypothetical protein